MSTVFITEGTVRSEDITSGYQYAAHSGKEELSQFHAWS